MRCIFTLALLLGIAPGLFAAEIASADRTAGLSPQEVQEGFVNIFDGKSLAGWVGVNGSTESYYVRDGMLVCKEDGKNPIFTEKEYANFVFRLEIRLDSGANNGIGIRTHATPDLHIQGSEIQVLDDSYFPCWKHGQKLELREYQYHGSLYGVVPARRGQLRPLGEWNEEEIVCDGRTLKITLNGTVIVECDLDEVKPIDGHEHPPLLFDRGRISLLAHGNYGAEVFFRNLRVKELP